MSINCLLENIHHTMSTVRNKYLRPPGPATQWTARSWEQAIMLSSVDHNIVPEVMKPPLMNGYMCCVSLPVQPPHGAARAVCADGYNRSSRNGQQEVGSAEGLLNDWEWAREGWVALVVQLLKSICATSASLNVHECQCFFLKHIAEFPSMDLSFH